MGATEKTIFPEEFLNKYKKLLGKEWESFFECIQVKQPKSFWVNTNKISVGEVKKVLEAKGGKFSQYSFNERAFFIEMEKPGDLEEFKSGQISLQEKAAMLPVIVLAPKEKELVLDACAAPGMKTIQLSNLMNNKGKIIACDVNSERIKFLDGNCKKYGLTNVETKRIDFRNLASKYREKFDKILLDAPCSSEGLVRKDREALREWSQKLVERKAQTQKELIVSAFDLLKKNGEMVYATCSFAPEENEQVVLQLLEQRKTAEVINVNDLLVGIKIRKNELCENCVRFYPQDNDTQQFFLAKIKKN
ncbi:MAG: RsmB/NOP family class I SAM-dependent RNA methyltransferase [archaeon]|jgi:NOL1/NOP2/sun family putative RNA methylase